MPVVGHHPHAEYNDSRETILLPGWPDTALNRMRAPRHNGGLVPAKIDRPVPDFGRIAPEHASTFLGIMSMLHSESSAPAYGRLLKKRLQPDDYVLLAHLFEEISVLVLHRLIPEVLVFDAFAFDLYWDELREDVMSLRQQTGNEKFCENFEIASERAREYRNDRPPKRRWHRRPEDEGPHDPPGGRGRHPLGPAPASPGVEPAMPRPSRPETATRR